MYELIYYLKEIGNFSLDAIWFPLAIWTLCCGIAFIVLRNRESLNPLFHYHLRTAALLSLPFGIGAAALMNRIPAWFAESNIETAFFVVQNPIELVPSGGNSSAEFSINWMEPSLLIGLTTVILGLVSLFMLGRLISSYLALKSLYRNLDITELQDVLTNEPDNNRAIKLAFHDHPLVPFTFGWKQPVIVLPKLLQHEPEKLEMALQHELTHIKRGDYLLQLALSMIESLFWFHPLIRYGNQEIDTYREISCDQEVLSRSDFSIKSYASLLYELVPLSSGAGRLSVSMAVKNSTLKKRIKTMKYHKLHKASFRQSIAFLLLMIVGITLPIACSDLRGPEGLSEQEIINTKIDIGESTLLVNGKEIFNYRNRIDNYDLPPLSSGFALSAKDYGTIVFSGVEFDGATKNGTISGNKISFETNGLRFVIEKSSGTLIDGDAKLWVRHLPKKVPATWNSSVIPYSKLKEVDFSEWPFRDTTPSKTNTEEDFFVVVEEMPKLIDGMKSIQSKIEYPTMARRAGIEGRVTVQFIVNESGDVENAQVVRGIGGGADEEALRVVRQAKFEPGMQRGKPVRVRYALSVNFRLEDSNYSSMETELEPDQSNGLN